MSSEPIIHDRGRGPEIRGTRITVYDILDHHPDKGWTPEQLATMFRVSVEHIDAALKYIKEHRDEVMGRYQKMLEFAARGDSPEVRATYARSRARFEAFKREMDRKKGMRHGDRAAG
jgi:uncharacterized protein (DUF433 family)